jgi:hypothetical protein
MSKIRTKNGKINIHIKRLALAGFGLLLIPNIAYGRIIFQNDTFGTVDSDSLVINSDNGSVADILLQFGQSVAEYLKWDVGDSRFELSDDLYVDGNNLVTGSVGIGDTTPASALTVGSGDLFQVNSSGNIVKLNNVTYSWPGSQGAASTVLTNNGSGTLTWAAGGGGSGGGPETVKMTADQTVSTTTLASATGMSFSVTAGTYYHFKFLVNYRTAATTTGIGIGLTFPASTASSAEVSIPVTTAGTAGEFHGWITASGGKVTSSATPTNSATYLAIVEGNILPSTTGILQLQFCSEVASSNAIMKQGSVGFLYTIP